MRSQAKDGVEIAELERLLRINRDFAQLLSLGYLPLDRDSAFYHRVRLGRIDQILQKHLPLKPTR